MESKYNTRIEWIDAVKGIGIILVMLSHSCGVPFLENYLIAGFIPLFFLSSGLTLKREFSYDKLGQKSKRLLYPYFIYGFFIISFMFVKSQSFNYLLKCVWALLYSRYCLFPLGSENNVALLESGYNAPFWFLTAMCCAILWTFWYLKIKKLTLKIICILVYSVLTFICSRLPILLPWSLDTSFFMALFIILGVELKDCFFCFLQKHTWNIIVLAIVLLLYFPLVSCNGIVNLSVRIYGQLGYYSVILCFIIGVAEYLIISIILSHFEKVRIIHLFSKIGRCSLRLMCIHCLIFTLLNKLFSSIIPDINSYLASIIEIIFVVWLCIALDLVINKYNEKWPLLKWL